MNIINEIFTGSLLFIMIALIIIVNVAIIYKLVSKTGNNGWLCLLSFIPFVNLIFYLYMAFSEWPVEKEIKELKQKLNNKGA